MDLLMLQKKLEKVLSPFRYRHSLGVMDLAYKLALIYGVDQEQAALAGLLHDVAREIEPPNLLALAKENKLFISETEKKAPLLLHGKVGSILLSTTWGVNDREVLEAVALHVTGAPKMSLLAQIIFISDFAEPGRDFFPSKVARKLAESDRATALHFIFQQEIAYLLNHGFLLEQATVEAWNQLIINGDLNHGRLNND